MKLVGISSHLVFYLVAASSNTKYLLGTFSAFEDPEGDILPNNLSLCIIDHYFSSLYNTFFIAYFLVPKLIPKMSSYCYSSMSLLVLISV